MTQAVAKPNTFKRIEFDEWEKRFSPILNEFNSNRSLGGCMLETYGEELQHVLGVYEKDPRRVWTWLDGEDGEDFIGDGLHYVNRLGYIITENPAEEDTDYEVFFDF